MFIVSPQTLKTARTNIFLLKTQTKHWMNVVLLNTQNITSVGMNIAVLIAQT